MEVYNSYVKELTQDTFVDEISLKEKALFLPGIKAKWVARLINHKKNLFKLEKEKQKTIGSVIEIIQRDSPVKLHSAVIKEKAETCDEIKQINEKISDEKAVIEFLERVEKIVSSMSFDISNIVKIVQLETS